MKKMLLGLSSVLLVVGSSVMGMCEDAIKKWAHLVPTNAVTERVNKELIAVVTHPESLGRNGSTELLVASICDSTIDRSYANYVHMVFVTALPDCCDEERNKFGGMLAAIASDKCGGGGANPSTYWNDYESGCFNSCTARDEDLDWASWK